MGGEIRRPASNEVSNLCCLIVENIVGVPAPRRPSLRRLFTTVIVTRRDVIASSVVAPGPRASWRDLTDHAANVLSACRGGLGAPVPEADRGFLGAPVPKAGRSFFGVPGFLLAPV